ncbi:MAG TPA: hypothetical protein DHN33_11595 [Eubacteriaceae bacterium]|nr:hypothetical protein [Eubacteriaceae bacterium]
MSLKKDGHAMYTARLKFVRKEELKYLSHLDMQRMVQRTLRRAKIPMKYSEGFNPHPKLSFASAMSVGLVSEGEYLDVELEKDLPPHVLKANINAQAPRGFAILDGFVTDEKLSSLSSRVAYARYRIVFEGVKSSELRKGMDALWNKEEIPYTKKNKKGKRITRNIRPMIHSVESIEDEKNEDQTSLEVLLSAGSEMHLKPEVLIDFLCEQVPIIQDSFVSIRRLDLYDKHKNKLMEKE